MRLARWLEAYGPQLTVALGAIAFAFISLIPRVRDEGWLWLISSITGLVFLGAAVLTVLVLLLRGWLPGRPLRTRADRT